MPDLSGRKSDTLSPIGLRGELELQRSEMDKERQSWISHWREITEYTYPRRGRFQVTDHNRGERRTSRIIDTTPTIAARTLASGMMSGVTSPARPWFRLSTPDPSLAELGPVKEWLQTVAQLMQTVFLRSNIYNSLPIVYLDIGSIGTSAMLIEEELSGNDLLRTYPFPIGSYMIAQDERGIVNTFFRDFRMSVQQLVDKFGYQAPGARPGATEIEWEHFSEQVRALYVAGQRQTWIEVAHCIRPNTEYDPNRAGGKYRKFRSYYYERGYSGTTRQNYDMGGTNNERYLRIGSYDHFPVLCPRWEVAAGDVYGSSCPGMISLGDNKQLQLGERRAAQAIEKQVNPPMVGPNQLRNMRPSILPGDITFIDEPEGTKGFRPAHEIRFATRELEEKQGQIRLRINEAYFKNLFLMMASSDRKQITAREIEERHSEKMLIVGPVLERLNQDLLNPLIDITFDIMFRRGLIPEPPEEIQGVQLRVEYISVMAQAQKLAGLEGIERFLGFAGEVAKVDAQVLDKIDRDQLIDVYANTIGVPQEIIVPDEQVEIIRKQRAQQQQQQAAAEQAAEGAKAAKDLSQAKLEGDSGLSRLLQMSQSGQVA